MVRVANEQVRSSARLAIQNGRQVLPSWARGGRTANVGLARVSTPTRSSAARLHRLALTVPQPKQPTTPQRPQIKEKPVPPALRLSIRPPKRPAIFHLVDSETGRVFPFFLRIRHCRNFLSLARRRYYTLLRGGPFERAHCLFISLHWEGPGNRRRMSSVCRRGRPLRHPPRNRRNTRGRPLRRQTAIGC